ncbi:hypothetical protein NA8A_20075 [Nitratireductor indicus C115]|uniref:Secreted Zn-dependent protease n=1 Tax=Nitratireductor indicus C115 TaxID=1231190 RepID=K2PHS7_9HYPH|nr:DUF922 domain-containing protein [Nitratireductor indicus]EKF40682.1 hypothetical protein NA8A_20075 [Nitratireductor indicus C115]SFQ42972.1 Predicted secreted Zn-dependent protease [Nitratireductor indicus]
MRVCGLVLTVAAVLAAGAARAEWRATERVETYTITGQSGIELYRSIGERGPKIGMGRVIAYTDFKLTWRRDYQPRRGNCTLASAKPNLVITYRLPKPSQTLPPQTRQSWETFIAGVTAHERVHGEFIVEMVRKIEAVSVGLSAENDPKCQKVRQKLQEHLGALSQEQRRRGREFDREEMSDGGNVHRLVLALVNG